MKKTISGIVILGIAGIASAPLVIGSKIESITSEQIEKSDAQLQKMLETSPYFNSASIKLDSYEKNYLGATAKSLFSMELNPAAFPEKDGKPQKFEIPMISQIEHGPYLGGAGFGWAKATSTPDLSKFDLPEAITNDTVTTETIVNFGGGLKEVTTVSPIKHTAEDGTVIDFAGAQIKVDADLKNRLEFEGDLSVNDLKVINADQEKVFHLKPYTIDIESNGDIKTMTGKYQAKTSDIKMEFSDSGKLHLKEVHANGEYKQANDIKLLLGNHTITLNHSTFTSTTSLEQPLKVPEIMLYSSTKQRENNDIDSNVKYTAKLDPSMMAAMKSPVNIDEVEVNMEVNAIPASVIKMYQQVMKNINSSADNEAVQAAIEEKMPEALKMIINNSSEIKLFLQAKTADGDLKGKANVRLKPDLNLTESDIKALFEQQNPLALLALLEGKGEADLAKQVTDKARLTPIIQMVAGEYVVLEDDKFKSKLLIKDGNILINGKPLPLLAQ